MFSQGRTGTGSRQHAYHDAVSKLVDSAADSQMPGRSLSSHRSLVPGFAPTGGLGISGELMEDVVRNHHESMRASGLNTEMSSKSEQYINKLLQDSIVNPSASRNDSFAMPAPLAPTPSCMDSFGLSEYAGASAPVSASRLGSHYATLMKHASHGALSDVTATASRGHSALSDVAAIANRSSTLQDEGKAQELAPEDLQAHLAKQREANKRDYTSKGTSKKSSSQAKVKVTPAKPKTKKQLKAEQRRRELEVATELEKIKKAAESKSATCEASWESSLPPNERTLLGLESPSTSVSSLQQPLPPQHATVSLPPTRRRSSSSVSSSIPVCVRQDSDNETEAERHKPSAVTGSYLRVASRAKAKAASAAVAAAEECELSRKDKRKLKKMQRREQRMQLSSSAVPKEMAASEEVTCETVEGVLSKLTAKTANLELDDSSHLSAEVDDINSCQTTALSDEHDTPPGGMPSIVSGSTAQEALSLSGSSSPACTSDALPSTVLHSSGSCASLCEGRSLVTLGMHSSSPGGMSQSSHCLTTTTSADFLTNCRPYPSSPSPDSVHGMPQSGLFPVATTSSSSSGFGAIGCESARYGERHCITSNTPDFLDESSSPLTPLVTDEHVLCLHNSSGGSLSLAPGSPLVSHKPASLDSYQSLVSDRSGAASPAMLSLCQQRQVLSSSVGLSSSSLASAGVCSRITDVCSSASIPALNPDHHDHNRADLDREAAQAEHTLQAMPYMALSNQEIVQHDLSPRFLSQPQSGHHENATSKAITSYESGDDVSTSCHTGSGDTSGCLYDAVSNAVSAASNRLVCVSDPIGIRRPQRKRRKARKSFLLDGRHPEDNGEDEDDEDDDFEYEDDSDGFKLTSRHTGKTVSPSRALRYSEDSGFQSDNSRRKPPDLPASHRQQESQLDPPQSHRPALSRDADSALTSKPDSATVQEYLRILRSKGFSLARAMQSLRANNMDLAAATDDLLSQSYSSEGSLSLSPSPDVSSSSPLTSTNCHPTQRGGVSSGHSQQQQRIPPKSGASAGPIQIVQRPKTPDPLADTIAASLCNLLARRSRPSSPSATSTAVASAVAFDTSRRKIVSHSPPCAISSSQSATYAEQLTTTSCEGAALPVHQQPQQYFRRYTPAATAGEAPVSNTSECTGDEPPLHCGNHLMSAHVVTGFKHAAPNQQTPMLHANANTLSTAGHTQAVGLPIPPLVDFGTSIFRPNPVATASTATADESTALASMSSSAPPVCLSGADRQILTSVLHFQHVLSNMVFRLSVVSKHIRHLETRLSSTPPLPNSEAALLANELTRARGIQASLPAHVRNAKDHLVRAAASLSLTPQAAVDLASAELNKSVPANLQVSMSSDQTDSACHQQAMSSVTPESFAASSSPFASTPCLASHQGLKEQVGWSRGLSVDSPLTSSSASVASSSDVNADSASQHGCSSQLPNDCSAAPYRTAPAAGVRGRISPRPPPGFPAPMYNNIDLPDVNSDLAATSATPTQYFPLHKTSRSFILQHSPAEMMPSSSKVVGNELSACYRDDWTAIPAIAAPSPLLPRPAETSKAGMTPLSPAGGVVSCLLWGSSKDKVWNSSKNSGLFPLDGDGDDALAGGRSASENAKFSALKDLWPKDEQQCSTSLQPSSACAMAAASTELGRAGQGHTATRAPPSSFRLSADAAPFVRAQAKDTSSAEFDTPKSPWVLIENLPYLMEEGSLRVLCQRHGTIRKLFIDTQSSTALMLFESVSVALESCASLNGIVVRNEEQGQHILQARIADNSDVASWIERRSVNDGPAAASSNAINRQPAAGQHCQPLHPPHFNAGLHGYHQNVNPHHPAPDHPGFEYPADVMRDPMGGGVPSLSSPMPLLSSHVSHYQHRHQHHQYGGGQFVAPACGPGHHNTFQSSAHDSYPAHTGGNHVQANTATTGVLLSGEVYSDQLSTSATSMLGSHGDRHNSKHSRSHSGTGHAHHHHHHRPSPRHQQQPGAPRRASSAQGSASAASDTKNHKNTSSKIASTNGNGSDCGGRRNTTDNRENPTTSSASINPRQQNGKKRRKKNKKELA